VVFPWIRSEAEQDWNPKEVCTRPIEECETALTPMNTNEKLDDGIEKEDEKMFRSMVGGLNYLTHTSVKVYASSYKATSWSNKENTEIVIGQVVLTTEKALQGMCLGSISITWSSKKQENVGLSSSDVEHVAASSARRHTLWLRKLLVDLGNS
ncbi:LOW QUALITY PROTEIN: hypothetical protein V2J09_004187, partial [Rumex salicifolius]